VWQVCIGRVVSVGQASLDLSGIKLSRPPFFHDLFSLKGQFHEKEMFSLNCNARVVVQATLDLRSPFLLRLSLKKVFVEIFLREVAEEFRCTGNNVDRTSKLTGVFKV
jgi:hypothetical protein